MASNLVQHSSYKKGIKTLEKYAFQMVKGSIFEISIFACLCVTESLSVSLCVGVCVYQCG